jgi:hypothetical protein
VTAVALQVPDADLSGTRIAVWARISLFGHAPQLQVSRIGQAMLLIESVRVYEAHSM